MKNPIYVILTLSILLFGCDYELSKIDDELDFKYGYINDSRSKNIYFSEQGIFHGRVIEVYWNDEYIIALVELTDSNSIDYYFINKSKYSEDPNQIESRGIGGPYKKNQLETEFGKFQYWNHLN
ncbi:MAG: hypothetical protein KDC84_14690 [Crocinitomicaceae bacterium]|nr:hypothetical protein [Crocinitomicaceae bacterium]